MTEIVSFTPDHLDAAARLLADRQASLRAARPELPEAFTRPDACQPLLEKLLATDGAHGVVAVRDGEARAYLLGHAKFEEPWGRACWSPIEGQACAEDAEVETMRDVYAAWSRHWVDRGVFLHYVLAPADDAELLDAWFTLNFGKMQAHGIASTAGELVHRAHDFEVRPMGPDDVPRTEPLVDLIAHAHLDAPVYAVTLPERLEEFNAASFLDPDDPGHIWIAVEGDRALGLAGFWDTEPGPMVPDGAWELGVAMTAPDARGRGVQRALLAAGFAAAREAGVGHVSTDWRTANLLSSRTWPRLGFRPTHYRLHRRIDDRVAWAGRPLPDPVATG